MSKKKTFKQLFILLKLLKYNKDRFNTVTKQCSLDLLCLLGYSRRIKTIPQIHNSSDCIVFMFVIDLVRLGCICYF